MKSTKNYLCEKLQFNEVITAIVGSELTKFARNNKYTIQIATPTSSIVHSYSHTSVPDEINFQTKLSSCRGAGIPKMKICISYWISIRRLLNQAYFNILKFLPKAYKAIRAQVLKSTYSAIYDVKQTLILPEILWKYLNSAFKM